MSNRLITGRGGGGKGGGKQPDIEDDTLFSNSIGRIIDIVGEGEIGGLVDGLKSVYLDGTQVMRDDGELNFDGFDLVERVGTPDQATVPGYANAESEVSVSTLVEFETPVIRTIADPELDAVRVKLRWPALYRVDKSGDVRAVTIEVFVDVRVSGGSFATVIDDKFTGKSSSPYEREYRINLPKGGSPWDIRVRTADNKQPDPQWYGDTYWSSYTQIIDSKLSYPNTAYYALRVNAELFGSSIPSRAYEIAGIKIQVPTNYDPETRTYATTGPGTSGGIWDGTFKRAVSDNPAWVFYDLLTEPRYGLGDEIPAGTVDKWSLYGIAQYCDELVDDGKGGKEPRFTFNGVINTREQAFNVLRSVASCFRGYAYWGSGTVLAVQDAPSDPVKLVTPANVIDGTFDYQTSDDLVRHSVALVTWNDPANGYKASIEQVEDPEALATIGWRPLEIAAYGCTSQGQAHRMGKWALDSEQHETEMVTYKASYDHADVGPGQIVSIADPIYAGIRMGGRIASANANSVTVDAPVSIEAGETYTLSVVMPDGTIADRTLTNAPGETATLTFADALPESPIVNAMWVLSGQVVPRQFRVMAIKESEGHIYEISGLFYDPTKFDRVEKDINLTPPDYSAFPTGDLPAPQNLTFVEYLYLVGPTVLSGVTLSWSAPSDPRARRFEVQVKRPGDQDFAVFDQLTGRSYDVRDLQAGSFTFRVRTLDGIGNRSSWSTFNGILGGLPAPPSDVQNFRINVLSDTAYLTWDPVPDLDWDHYRIKYKPTLGGATWGSASDIAPYVTTNSLQLPALNGTFLIKAVDTSGSESVNATAIISNVGGILDFDVTEQLIEEPTFPGAKIDVQAINGTLTLASNDNMADWPALAQVVSLAYGVNGYATDGEYLLSNTVDLAEIFTSRVTADMNVFGSNSLNVMSAWVSLEDVENLAADDPSQWSTQLQIRITSDDPHSSPVNWSDWQNFLIGDYTARAYEFRLLMHSESPSITPIVDRLRVTVNMPDRVEADNDVIVPVGGLRVDFSPSFQRLKGIAIAAQNLLPGDHAVITAKDETGFNIIFKDSGGSDVERTTDWVAKGYGRKVAA